MGYGAATIVDHTAGPLPESIATAWPDGIDALVDVASDAAAFAALAAHVRRGGAAVSTVYAADPAALEAAGVRATNFVLQADGAVFAQLGEAVVAGELVPPPLNEVKLDEIPALFAQDAGGARGKTVIRVD
jgi:hypothetical protein